jgi:putative ATPase
MINNQNKIPLADRIRPESLDDFFGQTEIVGKKSYLRQAIENDEVPSMIFWGPPGSGKTTLAHIIAQKTNANFIRLSAVASGKKDLMQVLETARENQKTGGLRKETSLPRGKHTILFIDEVHRWNKAQQDALLPSVEKGIITLIGATTENPSFEVNSALISRSRVFVLKKLTEQDLEKIIQRALDLLKKEKYQPKADPPMAEKINIDADAIKFLAKMANGDARMALNTLEAAFSQNKKITPEVIKEILQKSHLLYDKNGEEHYNIISALHKSMRGGDANAGVYWLARMLEGGEDPIYIARRLVRFASEDIGLANNTALILANAVFDACHKLGMPECSVHLSQCVIYLSKSKKDITAYLAYGRAKKDVEEFGNLSVPLHIRNAPTKLMKNLGYGKNYRYTPLEDSSSQKYLPEELENRKYV